MEATMSDDLIRRAREALVDVAPGPWEAALEKGCHGIVASIQDEVRCVAIIGNAPETPEREPMRFANAGFIAAARDLVPAMADRLEAQEALLREAMAEPEPLAVNAVMCAAERDAQSRDAVDLTLFRQAIRAEALEEAAKLADAITERLWHEYKTERHFATDHLQGMSDGAGEVADAIRALMEKPE